jgi:hypothetical protein
MVDRGAPERGLRNPRISARWDRIQPERFCIRSADCRDAVGAGLIRIAITAEAYAAIEATLPLGTIAVEPKANEKGEREIWLDDGVINRLRLMREPNESYSDVILRLAALYPSTRGS